MDIDFSKLDFVNLSYIDPEGFEEITQEQSYALIDAWQVWADKTLAEARETLLAKMPLGVAWEVMQRALRRELWRKEADDPDRQWVDWTLKTASGGAIDLETLKAIDQAHTAKAHGLYFADLEKMSFLDGVRHLKEAAR